MGLESFSSEEDDSSEQQTNDGEESEKPTVGDFAGTLRYHCLNNVEGVEVDGNTIKGDVEQIARAFMIMTTNYEEPSIKEADLDLGDS